MSNQQRKRMSFYKVICDSALCGQAFYEFDTLDKCPHCGSRIADDNIGTEYVAVYAIDSSNGKITLVDYERVDNHDESPANPSYAETGE